MSKLELGGRGATNQIVVVRLDRLILNAEGRKASGLKGINGFRRTEDFRPHKQGKIATYGRVRKFRSITSSSQISIQYQPLPPQLKPMRITLIADDESGLTFEEVGSVISQCSYHQLSIVELAIDFPVSAMNLRFVLRHGRFGKARRRTAPGAAPGILSFGGRACPKLVRAYHKEQINRFRVELEIHRTLLRKRKASNVFDLGGLARGLFPAHVQFAGFRWAKLEKHLQRKFGPEGKDIYEEARQHAQFSLRRATRFLSRQGVTNPHRFLGPLRLNRKVRAALWRWSGGWDA